MKTGLPALEGDDDLVDYYYIVMYPNTISGAQYRTDKKEEWPETMKRLADRFGFEWPPKED